MRNRQNGVLVYLSDAEKQHLVKQTAVAGLSVGAFIRKLIMGKEIRPRPPDEYVKLLREINAVGNNINQIAHIANAERHISADKIEEVLKMQDEIMRLVRSVRCWQLQKYGQSNQDLTQALNTLQIPTRRLCSLTLKQSRA